ncbi:hepatocyte cell adhesion molecule [Sarotherodon galilaeus]
MMTPCCYFYRGDLIVLWQHQDFTESLRRFCSPLRPVFSGTPSGLPRFVQPGRRSCCPDSDVEFSDDFKTQSDVIRRKDGCWSE